MRRALLVAFHFPPFSGSSGVQRTLKFTKYLPQFGWQPLVLSADRRAYPSVSNDLIDEIATGTVVHRAFALDAGRQLSVRGRYLGVTALPDRWVSWWPAAVWGGMRLIRRHRPDVIWTTYPIATAHLIGLTLATLSGLPLVADYRDAMVVADFPEDPQVRKVFGHIEARVIRGCRAAIFTTPRSRDLYRARYPAQNATKFVCIRNGYDEEDFAVMPAGADRPTPGRLRLLHSGLLKLSERDPRPFLMALADLLKAGIIGPGQLEVVLRAPGDEATHRQIICEIGVQQVVRVEPAIAYGAALKEMTEADVLLLFQDANCNHLVPAKLYEYIRARKPVLALTDREGETADLMTESGAGLVLDIGSRESIRQALPGFLDQVRAGAAPRPSLERIAQYSRRDQARQLGQLLTSVSGVAR